MAELAEKTEALDPFGRIGGRRGGGALDEERRNHFAGTIRRELPLFVKVHKAWLVMLAKTRIVEQERARKIMLALEDVGEEAIREMIATWTPSSWEPMIQLERCLTSRAGQAAVRKVVEHLDVDRPLFPDHNAIAAAVETCEILEAVEAEVGPLGTSW